MTTKKPVGDPLDDTKPMRTQEPHVAHRQPAQTHGLKCVACGNTHLVPVDPHAPPTYEPPAEG